MATWLLVRHAQSVANAEGWFSGHADVPLTSAGRAQADALARALDGRQIDRVVSSDLARAVATARPVAQRRGLPVETSPRLRERDLGAWTRQPVRTAPPAFREVLHRFRVAPPGGESLSDVAARVTAWLADQPDGASRTLVVAHGGVLRALLGLLDELPDDRIPQRVVGNAEVFEREVSAARWAQLHARCVQTG